ncbi:ATP-binding protein [soil metagenome]
MFAMTSIRARLSVFLLLSALLTALVIGVFTYRHAIQKTEQEFDQQLQQVAHSLRDQGAAANPYLPYGADENALDVAVQIWTSKGVVLYVSHPAAFVPDRAVLGFSNLDAGGKLWRVYSMTAQDRIIQVAQPFELRRGRAVNAAFQSLFPLLAFAPIMALLISGLIASSLLPVRRVAEEVSQRDARMLDPISEAGVPDEVQPLVGSLNSLLIRLKDAFSQQRAFVADAAHELRSPLTALKLQLQLLERAQGESERKLALAKLHEGVDRASHLIEQLIAAARSDPNDTTQAFQLVDLAELARHVIADLFMLAQSRKITIELDAPERLMLSGDPGGLRILLRNLLDNAIRYTPTDGRIHTALAVADGKVVLRVEDSGPGIPEAERDKVFERFYRREPNDQIGSGLGLSIVRNIAGQHGAHIELGTSEQLGGLKFAVVFRASETPSA